MEELAKIGHFIAGLRSEKATLQHDLELCERSRDAMEAKCRSLVEHNSHLKVMLADCAVL